MAQQLRITPFVPFPAQVKGAGPVTIAKQNGIWTVGFNIGDLAPLPVGADPTTKLLVLWDEVTQSFINGNLTLVQKSLATADFIVDGGGQVITTGIKGDLEIGFDCTITRASLLADQVGSLVMDVWKAPYGSFPPTVADTITSATPPTIITANKSQDSTLSGWTTAITAGDTLRFNINSCSSITRVCLALDLTKTT